jgi:hypothetical protein
VNETIVRVVVKRLSASSNSKELMAGFIMTPGASQIGKDQSWEILLANLRDRSVETGVCVKMKLEATATIGRAVEESLE